MKKTILVVFLLVPFSANAQECFRTDIGFNPTQIIRTQEQINYGIQKSNELIKPYMLLIGMSNSQLVGDGFRRSLRASPLGNPNFKFFNGGISGKAAYEWAMTDDPWNRLFTIKFPNWRITKADIGILMIMVVVKDTKLTPLDNAVLFKTYMNEILIRAENEFPNLKVVYISNNYYGGYDVKQDKTPEPHGYFEYTKLQEIQDEWSGQSSVNGIVLWSNGPTPNPNRLNLLCPTDVQTDGVHLNTTGSDKFGGGLRSILNLDPITSIWFW